MNIGPYIVERELGRGGMGVVYAARHSTLNRRVAIKVLLSSEGNRLSRFELEGNMLARLRHPNVVSVHEVGVFNDQPYLVMDFVEGETLEDRLESEDQVVPTTAAAIVRDLAQGVQHAHDHGVLHRDIKPANVLLTDGARPLLTDFGLARELNAAERERLTRTGQMLGTPAYMAPEQVRSRKDITEAADVYALGATLYHLLAGRPPFTCGNLMAALAHTLASPAEPVRTFRPDVPEELDAVCLKCLAKKPADRYASAADLASDLDRFLTGREVRVRVRKRAIFIPALAVLVLLVGAVLAGGLLLDTDSPDEPEATGQETLATDPQPGASAQEPIRFRTNWPSGHRRRVVLEVSNAFSDPNSTSKPTPNWISLTGDMEVVQVVKQRVIWRWTVRRVAIRAPVHGEFDTRSKEAPNHPFRVILGRSFQLRINLATGEVRLRDYLELMALVMEEAAKNPAAGHFVRVPQLGDKDLEYSLNRVFQVLPQDPSASEWTISDSNRIKFLRMNLKTSKDVMLGMGWRHLDTRVMKREAAIGYRVVSRSPDETVLAVELDSVNSHLQGTVRLRGGWVHQAEIREVVRFELAGRHDPTKRTWSSSTSTFAFRQLPD